MLNILSNYTDCSHAEHMYKVGTEHIMAKEPAKKKAVWSETEISTVFRGERGRQEEGECNK